MIATKVSTYVKNILGAFPIMQINVVYGACHLQLAMLVEQDCICVVQASQSPAAGRLDLLNTDESLPLAYGLTQTSI